LKKVGEGVEVDLSRKTCVPKSRGLGYCRGFFDGQTEQIET
jgi:hypothetical protein